ncbi:RNA polymerase subunit sigma-70 [Nocardia yamanashiensis]|uniref:RNA polymerase subunit sigma-70 n=1 Tax=Nocardia yamanashiensis TaxID=209247 RepID=UPI000832E951|nr:RNA polymerase subunit sigma-70 [Nocardia yamanashiensis]
MESGSWPMEQFAAETERFRRELLAHCYRMVGSAHDAEDLVQETYLRAWRGYEGFEGRASVRSWLYRIATNVCLTAVRSKQSRVLPSGLAGPCEELDRPPNLVAHEEVSWLEPLPDTWLPDGDPAAVVIARESLRLALIAGLQHLPGRQRAILLLREVLAFSAAETAEILGTTVPAVKSGLQRARARLDELAPRPGELLEPTDPRARALLDGYITAFEKSDAALLQHILRVDATLEATPFRDWTAGVTHCLRMLERYVLGSAGDWRMLPAIANGQPAAVTYRCDAAGEYRAYGVTVLEATASGVTRVVAFHHSALITTTFGFPEILP